jgi:cytochrome c oxidase assembly protein Cox11
MLNFRKNKAKVAQLIVYSLLIVIILGGAMYIAYFLYDNFCKAMSYTPVNESPEKAPMTETVDWEKFERIKEKLNKKGEDREVNVSMDFY